MKLRRSNASGSTVLNVIGRGGKSISELHPEQGKLIQKHSLFIVTAEECFGNDRIPPLGTGWVWANHTPEEAAKSASKWPLRFWLSSL